MARKPHKPKEHETSAQDAVVGLVENLLESEVHPAEIAYALTAAGVDLAIQTAPQQVTAFMVVLQAAFDAAANHADGVEGAPSSDGSNEEEQGACCGVTIH